MTINSIMKKDKILHLVAGALITGISWFVFTNLIVAFTLCTIAAFGKELYDFSYNKYIKQKHQVELADALYTLLGGLIVCLLVILL